MIIKECFKGFVVAGLLFKLAALYQVTLAAHTFLFWMGVLLVWWVVMDFLKKPKVAVCPEEDAEQEISI